MELSLTGSAQNTSDFTFAISSGWLRLCNAAFATFTGAAAREATEMSAALNITTLKRNQGTLRLCGLGDVALAGNGTSNSSSVVQCSSS